MNSFWKILVIIEIIFYEIIIEFLLLIDIKIQTTVKIIKKFPVIKGNVRDEQIVAWINTILYKMPLKINFFKGNCKRYVYLLIIFFIKKYRLLRVILGIKNKFGKIEGHMWLENCNVLFYEPPATLTEYKKVGEIKI